MTRIPWAHLDWRSERAPTWRAVYGSLSVPIESSDPIPAHSPIGPAFFYKVDVRRLEPDQLERAIAHIAKTFCLPEAEVREGVLGDEGIPLLASEIAVTFQTTEP